MTEDGQPGEEPEKIMGPDVNAMSVGRVDWSPLSKLTGTRPLISKYGLARYSPLEWRTMNAGVLVDLPSAAALDQESKNLMGQIAKACDQEQVGNTLKLRQRAIDISSKNFFVCQYREELRAEMDHLAEAKYRMMKAVEILGIVEGINSECREIRRNRFVEDLVRDTVEEELFQEMGLCQEIRQLYTVTLHEFDMQNKTIRSCYEEVQCLWSDQKETLDLEAETIGLKSSSSRISFVQGNARLEGNMSTPESWEANLERLLTVVKETLEFSKSFRRKVDLVLQDSATVIKKQEEKVLRAFFSRIGEVNNARMMMEAQLDRIMKEIAHAEGLYTDLTKLGRHIDFSLKVVQTRLENRRHRPGAENCRDSAQFGLLHELKVISERVTALQTQMTKISEALNQLYETRKKLERQIHVKRHSLALDRDRCLRFRSKFPNPANLLGY